MALEFTNSGTRIVVFSCKNDNGISCNLNINNTVERVLFNTCIEFIEKELVDIIESSFNTILRDIDDINFYIAGGKALNNIVSNKVLFKSFDYDIHVKNDRNIIPMRDTITLRINEYFNLHYRKLLRFFIYQKLLKLKLIDPTDRELLRYYLTDDLFYFGYRQREDLSNNSQIQGNFIKIKFSKTIDGTSVLYDSTNQPYDFTNCGFDFYVKDPLDSLQIRLDYTYNRLKTQNAGNRYNIFYLPISDIDADAEMHFYKVHIYTPELPAGIVLNNDIILPNDTRVMKGTRLVSETTIKDGELYKNNGINYLNYVLLLFNLISYIKKNEWRSKKNYNKLRKLIFNLNQFTCKFYIINDIVSLKNNTLNLAEQIKNIDLGRFADETLQGTKLVELRKYIDANPIKLKVINDTKEILYSDPTNITNTVDIINKIVNNYLGYRKNGICLPYMGRDSRLVQNIFLPARSNDYNKKLANITFDLDTQSNIYFYTCDLYKSLNTYVSYRYNEIDTASIQRFSRNSSRESFNLEGGPKYRDIREFNDPIANYDRICTNIDTIFNSFHTRLNQLDRTIVNDTFDVYTFQLTFSFISTENTYSNINFNDLRAGDCILLQQYVSTSFYPNIGTLGTFVNTSNYVYKIKIDKRSISWLFLGNYSAHSPENEILIKRSSILVFEKSTMEIISTDGGPVERQMLHFSLIDSSEPRAMELYTNKISGTYSINENLFLSQSYTRILDFTNRNYFLKKYKHANKLKFKNGSSEKNLREYVYPGEPHKVYYYNYDHDVEIKTLAEECPDEINAETINCTYRPVHGLIHAVRVSIWAYLYCLNIKKYNYNSRYNWADLITPEFMLKISIASLFLVSGRESEQGFLVHPHFEDHVEFKNQDDNTRGKDINGYTIDDYKNAYSIYRAKSIENFETAIRSDPLIYENIFTDEDIVIYKECIGNYYNWETYDTDIKKLIGFIFKNAHNMDLVRVKRVFNQYTIPVDKATDRASFDFEKDNFIMIAMEMCKISGDTVLLNYYAEQSEPEQYKDIEQLFTTYEYYDNFKNCNKYYTDDNLNGYQIESFIKFNNNPQYCISRLIDYIKPISINLINDIEENKRVFTPPLHPYDINNLSAEPVNFISMGNLQNGGHVVDTGFYFKNRSDEIIHCATIANLLTNIENNLINYKYYIRRVESPDVEKDIPISELLHMEEMMTFLEGFNAANPILDVGYLVVKKENKEYRIIRNLAKVIKFTRKKGDIKYDFQYILKINKKDPTIHNIGREELLHIPDYFKPLLEYYINTLEDHVKHKYLAPHANQGTNIQLGGANNAIEIIDVDDFYNNRTFGNTLYLPYNYTIPIESTTMNIVRGYIFLNNNINMTQTEYDIYENNTGLQILQSIISKTQKKKQKYNTTKDKIIESIETPLIYNKYYHNISAYLKNKINKYKKKYLKLK